MYALREYTPPILYSHIAHQMKLGIHLTVFICKKNQSNLLSHFFVLLWGKKERWVGNKLICYSY